MSCRFLFIIVSRILRIFPNENLQCLDLVREGFRVCCFRHTLEFLNSIDSVWKIKASFSSFIIIFYTFAYCILLMQFSNAEILNLILDFESSSTGRKREENYTIQMEQAVKTFYA